MSNDNVIVLVGLGNPEEKYSHNRHNIGFMAVDKIFHRYNFSDWKKKFKALFAEGKIDGKKVYLLKPQTFMNLSGEAVLSISSFYKIKPENIIVFYDELDIEKGKLRVKKSGGNNGHNGLKSIDKHIGKNYVRVKIGIGRPEHKEDVSRYVLSNFSKSDNIWLEAILDNIADELALLLNQENDKFMNNIALKSKK